MGQIVSDTIIYDTKKVLVLCQRKRGPTFVSSANVETTTVPKIKSMVRKLIGENHMIEFLTDLDSYMGNLHITNDAKGDVDFNLVLDHNADNEKAKAFIKSHPYHYDLLVLNTCPFRFIPYDILFGLLKMNGLLVLSFLSNVSADEHKMNIESLHLPQNFYNYFVSQESNQNLFIRRSLAAPPLTISLTTTATTISRSQKRQKKQR